MSDFIMLVNITVQTPSLGKLFLNCYINIQLIKIDIYLLKEQHVCVCPHVRTHPHVYILNISPSFRSQEYMLQEPLLYLSCKVPSPSRRTFLLIVPSTLTKINSSRSTNTGSVKPHVIPDLRRCNFTVS